MNTLIQRALTAATDTRALRLGHDLLPQTAELFREQFGDARAVIVADPNTFAAAGEGVAASFRHAGVPADPPYLFTQRDFYAEESFVAAFTEALGRTQAIPVAVGGGAINDVVKLAAHRVRRPYMVVATAASMDGYTAYGASITSRGAKQTFGCPAPRAVLADIGVCAAAPAHLNAAGYADLAAKITAGADWLVADALGIEAIDPTAWELIQPHLRTWLGNPAAVRAGDPGAIGELLEGLLLGGFAMQYTQSSRCASGAEHQFSHLWDMEGHTYQGEAPSHGFKVGVATLAITRLYERLLQLPLDQLNVNAAVSAWPSWGELETQLRDLYHLPEIIEKSTEESRSKHGTNEEVRAQLNRLREIWPDLRARLRTQLIPSPALREMLATAGAPTEPEEIGISRERLARAHRQAAQLRRRFTVLDLALRTATLDAY